LNLYELPEALPADELFDPLAIGDRVLVERIVSTGQSTAAGEWLESERDEWVVLLQGDAEIGFADGTRTRLVPGDHVLLPAGLRHRVERTSAEPACIWLAVHAEGLRAPGVARA
jgi:cupin 2 domain-containing protein